MIAYTLNSMINSLIYYQFQSFKQLIHLNHFLYLIIIINFEILFYPPMQTVLQNPQSQVPSQQQVIQNQPAQSQAVERQQQEIKLPFFLQPFNKQDRQKQRSKRPKLGLRRLTDDRKLASIEIDIPIDQNTILRDKFDWDLSKDKISPTQFANQLVQALSLPPQNIDKIKQQILSQIMQHIKTNTRQKVQDDRDFIEEQIYARNIQAMRFNNNQDQDEEQDANDRKKMIRMRRAQMKRTTTYSAQNKYFREKKVCRNCKNENVTPGFECKNCKLPFQLLEMLNFQDRRVKLSAKYYEKIANKIPLLVYEAKKRHFQKDDFNSFYGVYNKIKSIFETCDELSKQNLNQVKYIMEKYHQYFLNGHIQFNDEDIIYQKDMKKDMKQEQQRPKRQRGRPRKVKILNDDLLLNSDRQSQKSSEEEEDSDDSDSSSSS